MGRVHKKKIAEYTKAAENANNSKVQTDAEGQTSISGGSEADDMEIIGENGENASNKNGGTKKTKKRKLDDVATDVDPLSNDEVEVPRKSRKSGAKQTKAALKEKVPVDEKSEEEEAEYEVQEVVDHKVEDGISYFLIRWKGYTKDDDTWEPEDTLACAALIEKFKKKQTGNDASKNAKKKSPGRPTAKSLKKGRKSQGQVDADGEPKEYEVEKIINYAVEKTGRLFLIRWKGYAAKHDTWEPEDNLNCADMIKKFMERMRAQEDASFKELRVQPKKTKRLVNETAPRTTYHNAIGRTSKRASKKRVYYGDSDN